jgi:hypothetical protein
MSDEIFHLIWEVPKGTWTVKKRFVGLWRITELQGYDVDYVDLCGPATLKIGTRGIGSVNFGAVDAEIDCKMDDFDERVLRFSFEGEDEGDSLTGRGYCLLDGDQIIGRMFRHMGDDFGFKAKRLAKAEKT